MRRAVIGLLLGTVWLSGIQAPSSASCVAPSVSIGPGGTMLVRQGEQVTASGPGWLDACNDTGGGSRGCSGPAQVDAKPYRDIQLAIRGPVTKTTRRHYRNEGSIGITRKNIVIGTADADEKGTLSFTFEMPDLPPGRYYLDTTPFGYPTIIRIGRPD